ncbi:protein-glutamate methylesterase/protein-glutamine glutaminase [Desulfurispora thermophila]|uniref:protein-glutamate methylesterase/protein-glutamine glutaminase n=1 Tax=Desulfurispora thermophila TaxID=265470 RepID=UPI00036D25A1|nr:chemotaxis response regulator protein-glutamate methylesterase [Desulfurispora thermophila]
MPPINVLVVDDSALMRRLITRFLEEDPQKPPIKVLDSAANGQEALEKAVRLRPDVVTLDVEMPVLDGLATLERLMRQHPVPVIMLSAHTTEGAQATIKALALGAVDFVAKPARREDMPQMVNDLRFKVRAASQAVLRWPGGRPARPLAVVRPVQTTRQAVPPAGAVGISGGSGGRYSAGVIAVSHTAAASQPSPIGAPEVAAGPVRQSGRIQLVVIGSSTGGPAALQQIIPRLPANLGATVVVVQHLPVGFSGPMAEHLDRKSAIKVRHAQQGDQLRPGEVLVAPAGYDLTFRGRPGNVSVFLDPGQGPVPPGGFRPSVDVTMLSAAEVLGNQCMGVLLTGMGRDGALGMQAIFRSGGLTIAEHESTCVVYGMPRAAVELGAANRVLPLPEIAAEIVKNI